MNVSCPSCNTVFRVDPAKVPAGGVRARCTTCRAIFRVSTEIMADVAPPVAAPATKAPGPSATAPAPHYAPVAPTARPAGAPQTARAVPLAPPVTRPAIPVAPAVPQPLQAPPVPFPPGAAPVAGRPVMPPAWAGQPTGRAASAPAQPAAGAPRPASGAPINPFLSRDPKQKARRLARALVSDLVVYHPDKRQEGLQNGTLKELFADEIKKSWEEYGDQIGPEVADAASYFNDALNEILSDGQKIF